GGGEASILADRPRLLRVHGRPRAAQERKRARHRVEKVEAGDVRPRVERLDRDALGGLPHQGVGVPSAGPLASKLQPAGEVRSVGGLRHDWPRLTLSSRGSKTAGAVSRAAITLFGGEAEPHVIRLGTMARAAALLCATVLVMQAIAPRTV